MASENITQPSDELLPLAGGDLPGTSDLLCTRARGGRACDARGRALPQNAAAVMKSYATTALPRANIMTNVSEEPNVRSVFRILTF